MKLDKKKYARQLIGVDRYFNSGKYNLSFKDCVGCLNYMTAVGKSFTAVLIIKRYFETNPRKTFVILVPNEFLIAQWQKLLNSSFLKKELEFIKVYTADYVLTNKLIINVDVLIIDEFDAFYSTERFKLIDKTYIKYVDGLALTATYEDYRGRHIKASEYFPIIDKIGEKEALREGYISKYIEYNLGLELTGTEKENYDKYSEAIRKNMSKFGKHGLDLAFKCLSGGKHKDGSPYTSDNICRFWAHKNNWHPKLDVSREPGKTINYLWHPRTIFGYSLALIKAIKNRKELLYNNSAKLKTATEILRKYKDSKTVVFSQSTVFADSLYSIVNQLIPNNSVLYHSQVSAQIFPSIVTGKMIKHGKKRLKDRAIYRMNNDLSNHLITSSVLDKGLDIPKLKIGMATSGTQNPTQHQQRNGRVKRINPFDEDSVSIIINLYIKNSKDQDWLNTRQSTATNIIFWIDNVEEITYKPDDTTNLLTQKEI